MTLTATRTPLHGSGVRSRTAKTMALLLALIVSGCGVASGGGNRSVTRDSNSGGGAVEIGDRVTSSSGAELSISALTESDDPMPKDVWQALRPDGSAAPLRAKRVARADGANFYIAVTSSGLVCVDFDIPAQSQGQYIAGGAGCSPRATLSRGIYVYSGDLDLAAIVVPDGYDAKILHGTKKYLGNNLAVVGGEGATVVLNKRGVVSANGGTDGVTVSVPIAHPTSGSQITITEGAN